MYKLVAFLAVLAVCAAVPAPKPKPQFLYSAPVAVGPVAPVAHVVPAVTTYSAYSSAVVHPPTVPVVHTPVVHAAPVVPVAYHAPAYYF